MRFGTGNAGGICTWRRNYNRHYRLRLNRLSIYLVSEIEVTNPAAYGAEFAPQAQAAIKAAGGRLIAIGGIAGAGAKPLKAITGTPPKRVAIQQWDSFDHLNAWFNSEEYQQTLKIGENYATFRRYAVEGTQ